jgi:hypothetical protein
MAQLEKNTNQIFEKLNQLPSKILNTKYPWEYYFTFDENDAPQAYFQLNKKDIKKEYFDEYYSKIKKSLPEANITIDENILTISGITHSEFSKIEGDFKSTFIPQKTLEDNDENNWAASSTSTKPTSGRQYSTSSNSSAAVDAPSTTKTLPTVYYPDTINFTGNVKFTYSIYRDPQKHRPNNFAFPIRPAWLSKGKGYGSVDPHVYQMVSVYLTRDEVHQPLENGEVHGAKKGHHTKAGGVGIQVCNDAYQDIHGQNHGRSHLKLKYSNNIGIFGRRVGKGTDANGNEYVHYRFDGPAYRH